jgi:hypothetical protein
MRFSLTNRVVQEEGICVYNMYNIAEKLFCTRTKPGRVASIEIKQKINDHTILFVSLAGCSQYKVGLKHDHF